jgi:hypothetical protein
MNKSEEIRAQERVAIAQDALAWEEAGALRVATQQYVKTHTYEFPLHERTKQARDVVLGECQVCALGGLLLAKAVRFDAVIVDDVRVGKMTSLLDHFSREQLGQIEAAFEGRSYPDVNKTDSFQVENQSWIQEYPNSTERFRAIMQNIIDNHGTFVP